MDTAKVSKHQLEDNPQPPNGPVLETGRGGLPTLRHGNIYFHSRYEPVAEARRQVDEARLDLSRPVIVIGLGLAYHVMELERRGAQVLVIEPETTVARLALDTEFCNTDVPLHIGDLATLDADETFKDILKSQPQIYVHGPTARLHKTYVDEARQRIIRGALQASRLNIAIVGPMYGGSLPMAEYLTRAFRKLGHRTLYVDNSEGHALFAASETSVSSNNARHQLTDLLVNFLDQWSYARVTEFKADICIALSQAPLSTNTAQRLARDGIATAYWFAENWRHMDYWRQLAPHYDWIFHIQPGEFEQLLREHGCRNAAFVQTACDPEIHKPVTLMKDEEAIFGCDISFAGAGYANRKRILSGLTDFGLKIWGVEWQGRELRPFLQQPGQRFTPELFAKIVAGSKINLNLHSSATHTGVDPQCDAVNPRVFEIAACGGFQLCDPCQNLDQFFNFDTELPVYSDLAALRERIDYFLPREDERETIAAKARERALRDHTYEHRAKQMLDCILSTQGEHLLRRGIHVERSIGEMVEEIGSDTTLGAFLNKLPGDLPFTQDSINAHLGQSRIAECEPEAVFLYLREMRNMAETVLNLRR